MCTLYKNISAEQSGNIVHSCNFHILLYNVYVVSGSCPDIVGGGKSEHSPRLRRGSKVAGNPRPEQSERCEQRRHTTKGVWALP